MCSMPFHLYYICGPRGTCKSSVEALITYEYSFALGDPGLQDLVQVELDIVRRQFWIKAPCSGSRTRSQRHMHY